MTSLVRSAAVAALLSLALSGVAAAQTGATTASPSTGSTHAAPATTAAPSALPSGNVPAAGTIGGIGTPPADVQGKPGLSTPGANKP